MKQATFEYQPEEQEKPVPAAESAHAEVEILEPGAATSQPEETGTDLVAIVTAASTALVKVFSDEKGLDPVIDKIKARVKAEKFDVTTEKGRARIGSVARDIGSAKMEMKRMGQSLTEDWRVKTKAVTSEASRMEKEMDALRDSVLAPRIEFENREKLRVDAHKQRLDQISDLPSFPYPEQPPTSAAVQARIDRLKDFDSVVWEEFAETAKAATEKVSKTLSDMLVRLKKAEDDAAELARHRAAEEARKQKERDDQIAAEAAAKAKKEAEDEADRQRVAAEKKAADDLAAANAKAEKERQDKIDAQARADKAEADRKAAEAKAESDKIVAAAKAEADKKAAAEAAAKAERDRAAAEKKAAGDAAAKRAADTAHRAEINNAAVSIIMEILGDYSNQTHEHNAKAIVTAIAQGKIPNVKIEY